MRKHLLTVTVLLYCIVLYGQIPSYYNGTNLTQSGESLKADLATLITNSHHTDLSYTPGVWDALKQTDLDPNNASNVLLIYGYNDNDGNSDTDRTRSKDANGGNSGDWNREHVYPKSLGNPNLGTSGPGADAHHIRSSDVRFNSLRSNLPFEDASGNARKVNNSWYPGDEWKGDVARMVMYMYLRYGNRCLPVSVGIGSQNYHSDMKDIFLEWNAEDPVSEYEINRNNLLENIQGNRNPFIDNPAFATSIWGGPQAENRFDGQTPTGIAKPVSFTATANSENQINLSATANASNDSIIVAYNENSTSFGTPNGSYSVNDNITNGGTILYIGLASNLPNHTSLKAETTYYYKAWSVKNTTYSTVGITTQATTEGTPVTPPAGNHIAFQGYEGTTNDTWDYSLSIPACNSSGSDVWDIVSSVGSITEAANGTQFFGVRDLDGNCGSSDGGTITFNSIDISNYEDVTLSFALNVVGYDVSNGDTIGYEIFYDNVSQGAVTVTQTSPYSTTGWETITQSIPNTVNSVKLVLSVKQNGGSDYAGFDDIQLNGTEIITTPTLLINEVDADTAGSDTLEFVEIYDGGNGNSKLDGFVLVMYNGSNNQSYGAYDLDGYTTNAEGYFVAGNEAVTDVNLVFPSNGLQNGADAVALYQGDATDFPNGTAITIENIVDAFVYDTNDSDDAELLVLLNEGQSQINEGGKGDKDNHSSQRTPNGEGGARNTSTYTQASPTPGTSNSGSTIIPTSNVLINEVDADTAGSDTLEFVELYDGGNGNSTLDGLVLVMYNGSNNQSYGAYDLDGYTTNSEGYFVAGNEAVANVSLVFPSNGLQNGADAVALYQGDATDFPSGTAVTTENLIDALVYDTNDGDDAELLVLLNEGQAQINEGDKGDKDNHSSQRIPNGEGGARNTATYTQDTPTPGTENGAVITPEGPVTIAEARNVSNGDVVTITGIITVSDQFRGSAYIQDDTAAIAVFDELVHGDGVLTIGDSITLTGTRGVFRDQIQLGSITSVENHGTAVNPIQPVEITLGQLNQHPAELVKIVNSTFPQPNQLLFGNSNYTLTDTSGTGALRIDNDVTNLVGLAQPETCESITGVVGRFYETFQLLPRLQSDMPCAEPYEPSGDDLTISKDRTLDVVTWNIEWFGDESNSPAAGNPDSDAIQKDKAKQIITDLNADIYTVEEIADPTLFTQLVSELEGYDFVLSDATSYPNDTEGVKQQVGFIYNTTTITPKSTKVLLESIHPYYNGGDASSLNDFPSDDKTRFFASGRLPFLMTADVTIDGTTEEIDFVALHARANSGSAPQERYDMRKFDVEVLKDSLDTYYADRNVIISGDFNDDVDVTVADISTTTTSYDDYIQDPSNYTVLSATLSEAGYRSYVFRENMIDHIMVTDELAAQYIDESTRVHYEFYDASYSRTVSDHFPVSARMALKTLTIDQMVIENQACDTLGSASVEMSGGIQPYTYTWSNGETASSISDLEAGDYSVIITDALNNTVSQEFVIESSDPVEFEIQATKETVYYGYQPEATSTLSTSLTEGNYQYEWSTGETSASIEVSPTETTTYSVTVTNEEGCSETKEFTINVVDVRCKKHWGHYHKVKVCYRGRTKCVHKFAVPYFLNKGATLGTCDENTPEPQIIKAVVSPNPVRNRTTVYIRSNVETTSEIMIYDLFGRLKYQKTIDISKGRSEHTINITSLRRGIYFLKLKGVKGRTIKILKF
ncbi:hypothetical protein UJ101_02168 [Flavobacteriaceae bacterium UJ101]|nr:hypothetical protein UJ101_02168 [Flavobacteriaceae bacterium UJ101]